MSLEYLNNMTRSCFNEAFLNPEPVNKLTFAPAFNLEFLLLQPQPMPLHSLPFNQGSYMTNWTLRNEL